MTKEVLTVQLTDDEVTQSNARAKNRTDRWLNPPERSTIGSNDEVARLAVMKWLLQKARPTTVYHCTVDVNNKITFTPTTTDYAWLSGVVREGFDPNHTTYYRVAVTDKRRYYSVVQNRREGGFVLLMTDLPEPET